MNIVAQALLKSKSVHLEPKPDDYFTWTSGRRSPIYCDNRQLISFPHFREKILDSFCDYISTHYSTIDTIAGTATAGIPWAAWIAQRLNKPMIYIRSKPKEHGLKGAIEGHYSTGEKVLIIEDLISTGKSSLKAYEHCLKSHLTPLAVLSIFTYNFKESTDAFSHKELDFYSLCTLDQLLEFAKEENILEAKSCESILKWRNSF